MRVLIEQSSDLKYKLSYELFKMSLMKGKKIKKAEFKLLMMIYY